MGSRYKQNAGEMQGWYEQDAAAVQTNTSNTKHTPLFVFVNWVEAAVFMVEQRWVECLALSILHGLSCAGCHCYSGCRSELGGW